MITDQQIELSHHKALRVSERRAYRYDMGFGIANKAFAVVLYDRIQKKCQDEFHSQELDDRIKQMHLVAGGSWLAWGSASMHRQLRAMRGRSASKAGKKQYHVSGWFDAKQSSEVWSRLYMEDLKEGDFFSLSDGTAVEVLMIDRISYD